MMASELALQLFLTMARYLAFLTSSISRSLATQWKRNTLPLPGMPYWYFLLVIFVLHPSYVMTSATKHQVDLILHVGAYARDESFDSWHAFATTRAMENQCFFLSLNRAGKHFGHSVFCGPWGDQNHSPETFSENGEELRHLLLDKKTLVETRDKFRFLSDRLDDYNLPLV